MPIYEYSCEDCKETVSIFFLSISEANNEESECPRCGSKNLKRILSGVSVIKGKSKPQKSKTTTQNKENTQKLAKTMRKASKKSRRGYGDDFKEVASRLEKGESSTSIEKSLRDRVGEKMQVH